MSSSNSQLVTLEERLFEAQRTARLALSSGRPLVLAVSFGKDSTAVLNLTLVTAATLKQEGQDVPPIWIVSADTKMENPQVSRLARHMAREAEAFGAAAGLEVRMVFAQPNTGKDYWVRVLSGRKLLSTPRTNGDCTVDLKIRPGERAYKAIVAECRSRGLLAPVTFIGTRFEESTRRAAHMTERGESAVAFVAKDGSQVANDGDAVTQWAANSYRAADRLTCSPIADWSTQDVFTYLQDAGIPGQTRYGAPRFAAFTGNFETLLSIYYSASTDCVIVVDPRLDGRRKQGCGARTGCWGCTMVGDRDASLEAMLLDPENDYLRPLNQFRNYANSLLTDLSARNYMGRKPDPITGYLQIRPNTFNQATCDALLRMLLTIDQRERERAAALAGILRHSGTPADSAAWDMAEPQFQSLTIEQVVMIDFISASDAFGPAGWAMRAWLDVVEKKVRVDVPAPRPATADSLPAPRFAVVPEWVGHSLRGLNDPLIALAGIDEQGNTPIQDGDFEIHAGGLMFWLDEHLEAIGQDGEAFSHAELVRSLLVTGIISYPASQRHRMHDMIRRRETLALSGLSGNLEASEVDQVDTISLSEHDALKWRLIRDDVAADEAPSTAAGWTRLAHEASETRARRDSAVVSVPDEIRHLYRRDHGLMCLGHFSTHFDGVDVARERGRLARRLGVYRREFSSLVERIESEIRFEARSLVREVRAGRHPEGAEVNDYGMGLFIGGELVSDTMFDGLDAASRAAGQGDLFETAEAA